MASGKSLELAAIKAPKLRPKCICGAAWDDHMRKDGKGVLAKFSDTQKHRPMINMTAPRRYRRNRR